MREPLWPRRSSTIAAGRLWRVASLAEIDHRERHGNESTLEPGEDPAATVARECREEVGFAPPLLDGLSSQPLFVTHELAAADAVGFDPNLSRFVVKLLGEGGGPGQGLHSGPGRGPGPG
jgi:hypothetical protein